LSDTDQHAFCDDDQRNGGNDISNGEIKEEEKRLHKSITYEASLYKGGIDHKYHYHTFKKKFRSVA
jgi:hypothetical protein